MNRKHFKAIAAIMADARRFKDAEEARQFIVRRLAVMMAADSPAFDRGKFIDACNTDGAAAASAEYCRF